MGRVRGCGAGGVLWGWGGLWEQGPYGAGAVCEGLWGGHGAGRGLWVIVEAGGYAGGYGVVVCGWVMGGFWGGGGCRGLGGGGERVYGGREAAGFCGVGVGLRRWSAGGLWGVCVGPGGLWGISPMVPPLSSPQPHKAALPAGAEHTAAPGAPRALSLHWGRRSTLTP